MLAPAIRQRVDSQFDASIEETKDHDIQTLCNQIERMMIEHEMGKPLVETEKCDPLMWELLLKWKEREQAHIHAYMRDIADAVRPAQEN